ncbi:MAG TPA: prepilin peptidase [Caulobacterales bacterium]|nr:prepilin peptidase [Caulobacterales bacterium]
MLEALPSALFVVLLLFAACSDVATMKIPNWLSIVLAAAFPLSALATGMPLPAIGLHLAFGFAVLAVGFLMFQFGLMGGGDAKLIAAASVWTGLGAFLPFAAWTMIAGGVMAAVLLFARYRLKPDAARPAFVNRLLKPRGGVPYGVAIMAGGLAALNTLPFATALTLP